MEVPIPDSFRHYPGSIGEKKSTILYRKVLEHLENGAARLFRERHPEEYAKYVRFGICFTREVNRIIPAPDNDPTIRLAGEEINQRASQSPENQNN